MIVTSYKGVLPLVVIAFTLTGCGRGVAIHGDEGWLDCDAQVFADRFEYYQCVRARESVRMNMFMELNLTEQTE